MNISTIRLEWLQRQGFVYADNGFYDLLDGFGKPVFKVDARILKLEEGAWMQVQERIAHIIIQLGGTIQ